MLRHDFKRSAVGPIFEDDDSRFVATFSCHLGHIYSDQKVKRSKLPKYLQTHKSHDLIGQYN